MPCPPAGCERSVKWTRFGWIRYCQNKSMFVGVLVKWGAPSILWGCLSSWTFLPYVRCARFALHFVDVSVSKLWFEHSRSFYKMLARFCNQVSWILKSVVSLLHGIKSICFHSACTASWIVSYLAGCWIQTPNTTQTHWILFRLRGLKWGETIISLYISLVQFEHHVSFSKHCFQFRWKMVDFCWLVENRISSTDLRF